MLLIQQITLQWQKAERAAKYANIRRAFPLAYQLSPLPQQNYEILLHRMSYFQHGTKIQNALEAIYTDFQQLPKTDIHFSDDDITRLITQRQQWIQKHTYQYYDKPSDVNCTNIIITKQDCDYIVTFCEQCCGGMPIYRGHNKDFQNIKSQFYGKNLLNETAFSLEQNHYGRILYQKRFTDIDTGNWYYKRFIFNFLHTNTKTINKNIFVSRKPDIIYTQLGDLF